MSKHTPGPWVYVRTERKIGVRDRSDTQSFGMVSAIAYIDEWDHEEFLHNARLIAQAPRLLEALEYMLNVCPAIDASGEDAHDKARAAIAAVTEGDSHE